ncbi:hypothetical protein J3A83DRAFT_3306417 [Scleroderma citrinum]
MSSTSVVATTSASTATSLQPTTSTALSSSSSTPEQTTTASTQPSSSPTTTPTSSEQPTSTSSHSTNSPSTLSPTPTSTTPAPSSSSPPTSTTNGPPSATSPIPTDPVTTVTGNTTVYVTTTNIQGQTITSAPLVVTQVVTSTNGAGAITTITQAVVNPTLAPNNSTNETSSNTGAVVGVFIVVGLAAASIVLWILFAIRRRYRVRRLEHDSAIQAAVAAAGFNRAPLDDDDDGHTRTPHSRSQFSSEMGQRGSYFGSLHNFGLSQYDDEQAGFNPYADYPNLHQGSRNTAGYVPAPTASPPPGAERPTVSAAGTEEFNSNRDRKSSFGHTPTYSAGSFEPLLSGYAQNSEPPPNHPPTPPPRNPQRLVDASNTNDQGAGSSVPFGADNEGSSDGGVDERLDPAIRKRKRTNSLGTAGLKDEEDYSRPVLTVRNIPDTHSEHSS